jgi:hypothetical protein
MRSTLVVVLDELGEDSFEMATRELQRLMWR